MSGEEANGEKKYVNSLKPHETKMSRATAGPFVGNTDYELHVEFSKEKKNVHSSSFAGSILNRSNAIWWLNNASRIRYELYTSEKRRKRKTIRNSNLEVKMREKKLRI